MNKKPSLPLICIGLLTMSSTCAALPFNRSRHLVNGTLLHVKVCRPLIPLRVHGRPSTWCRLAHLMAIHHAIWCCHHAIPHRLTVRPHAVLHVTHHLLWRACAFGASQLYRYSISATRIANIRAKPSPTHVHNASSAQQWHDCT